MSEFYSYVLLVLTLLVSTICFRYSVDRLFGQRMPLFLAFIGGVITNVFIMPVAIVCWVLDIAGVRYPLFKEKT